MSETGDGHLLEVHDASVSYGGMVAVRNVGLAVGPGEVVGVVGLNGAGKSSLLRGISGLVSMTGRCMLAGHEISGRSAADRAAAGLGHVPEGRRLFPRMSVLDNLRVGAMGRGRPSAKAAIKEEMSRYLPDTLRLFNRRAESLSGGEQQLVAIGRALVGDPSVIMLDEPSLGLSPIACQLVAGVIERLAGAGKALVLAEQNVNLALQLATRIYVIAFGQIVSVVETAEGDADELGDRIFESITQNVAESRYVTSE